MAEPMDSMGQKKEKRNIPADADEIIFKVYGLKEERNKKSGEEVHT